MCWFKRRYPQKGDMGKKVENVQKLLQRTGSNIKVNGYFSIGMVTAIKSFQKKNNIYQTGTLDSITMKALKKYRPEK